jgi:hypothetical protein
MGLPVFLPDITLRDIFCAVGPDCPYNVNNIKTGSKRQTG